MYVYRCIYTSICVYCMYVCTFICVHVYVRVRMYILCARYVMCIRVCVRCICVRVYVFVFCMYGCVTVSLSLLISLNSLLYVCSLYVTAIQTYSCDPNSVIGDLNLCSQSADMPDDSKTDTRDDSKIWIGSCSTDQMATQNRDRVILCECLLCVITYLLLSVGICMFTCIISCDRLIYFTSMIIYIILCDISECSFYLYSLFGYLSASFHV